MPSELAIEAGETVRFVNRSGNPMWPASDSHPSHSLYREFDPRRPVEPDSSWQFTFTRSGTWEYHDHMASRVTGSITVAGEEESIEECIRKNEGNASIYPECWQKDVVQIIEQEGLSAAFKRLEHFYTTSPRFRSNCHDVMHAVGAAAYDAYSHTGDIVAESGTAYCGFGFFHGFMEAMQFAEGANQFAGTRAYCEELSVTHPWLRGTCFHGIGHAVFDSLSAELWGDPIAMTEAAVAACETAGGAVEDRAKCGSGIYNSYANAMSAENYFLSFDDLDVAGYCGSQPPSYRNYCYGEVGIGYLSNRRLSYEEDLAFIWNLEPGSHAYMLYVYFGHYTKVRADDLDFSQIAPLCTAFPKQEHWQACVTGVLQGVREESLPATAHHIQFDFCAELPEHMRHTCASYIRAGAGSIRETQDFIDACLAVPGVPPTLCRGVGL